MSEVSWRFDTRCIHAGQEAESNTGAMSVPIYQTSSFQFRDSDHAARLFSLQEEGNIYTRLGNPTTRVFEERMASLEGGAGAMATSSGMAAIVAAVANIAEAGDEILSSTNLYGGTYNLFASTLPRMGIKVNFVNPSNPDSFRSALNENVKGIYTETIGNPNMDVADLEGLAQVAHEAGIPLIVDNTFTTPYLCRPFEFGADVVVHSATKFINGHGTSIGGVVVDGGRFSWDNGNFPSFTRPDQGYHGIRYAFDCGPKGFIVKARAQMLSDMGLCISPFNAFLLLQGLETLHIRMQRHCDNALALARFLDSHPLVAWVNYPGLESSPYFQLARRYFDGGCGAVLTFGIKGGREAGKRFVDSVKIFRHLANVGDVRSLVIHPATTTHEQLSPSQRESAGVRDDMIRLSIGIEDPEDLKWDLEQALKKSQG